MCDQASKIVRKYYILLSLIIFTILVYSAYSNTFNSPPALDDFHSFVEEPLVKIDQWSIDNFLSISKTKFGLKRFVPMTSFAFDIWLGKGSFINLHVTNLMIHLLNMFAIFFFISKLGEHAKEANISDEKLPVHWDLGLWVAAIWALQPVQTSAVTYLVQRMTSIMALFYVLSVAFYFAGRTIHWRNGTISSRAVLFYLFSIVCSVMSFLSKENSAMIPIMLFVTELWFFQTDLITRIYSYFLKRWVLLAICGSFLIFSCAIIFQEIYLGYTGRSFNMLERLLTQGRIVIWYISLLLWPSPSRFSLEHDIEISKSILLPPTTLMCLIIISIIIIFAVILRKKYPLITYGIVWFMLNLVIESTVVPLEMIFEHRVYLPSLGLIMSFLLIIFNSLRKEYHNISKIDFYTLASCFILIVCSTLTILTFQRNNAYSDILSLNEDIVRKAPNNPRAHANLAVAYGRVGESEKAIKEAMLSLEKRQGKNDVYYVAANTILLAYSNLNQNRIAVKEAEKFLNEEIKGGNSQGLLTMCLNLAIIYNRMEDYKGSFSAIHRGLSFGQKVSVREIDVENLSVSMLQRILHEVERKNLKLDLDGDGNFDPGDAPSKTWIAKYLLSLGYVEKGKDLLCRSFHDYPQDVHTFELLGNIDAEEKLNSLQSAKWSFDDKYVRRPFSAFNACMALSYLIREKKLPSPFFELGQSALNYAMRLQPNSSDVYLLKGWYSLEKQQKEDAVEFARKAIECDPDYSKAWIAMGFFLTKADQPEKAIHSFQKGLQLYPGYPQLMVIQSIIKELQNTES